MAGISGEWQTPFFMSLQNDERAERRKEGAQLHGWMKDTPLESDFTLSSCITRDCGSVMLP